MQLAYWVRRCVLVGLLVSHALFQMAFAQTAGVVRQVGGKIVVRNPSGIERPLQMGDTVRVGDVLESGAGGEAFLATSDGGAIAVRPGTLVNFKQFSSAASEQSGVVIGLVRGGLRVLTGVLGKTHRERWRLETPVATIGIRGTAYEPYVVDAAAAVATGEREGTYGWVRSGAIVLSNPFGAVDVNAERVGFAPAPAPASTRALATALRPVLLERMPAFFQGRNSVDGLFDSFAGSSDSNHPVPKVCEAKRIGSEWIKALDAALIRRDAAGFLAQFADDVEVTSRPPGATSSANDVVLSMAEFTASTKQSFVDLQKYWFERKGVEATALTPECALIRVSSLVREGGIMAGARYESTATEVYELSLQNGLWRARRAMMIGQ